MKRDIQIYAEKMINGDIEARNYLINHYIVIAQQIIEKNSKKTKLDKEELVQISYLGILNAINSYKLEYTYFSTYVINYLNRFILSELSKEEQYLSNTSVGLNNKNNNVEDEFLNFENNTLLKSSFGNLSKRIQKILYLHFYEGYSFEEIAKLYNLTISRVQQLYIIGLKNIKNELLYYKIIDNLQIDNNKMSVYNFLKYYFNEYSEIEIEQAIEKLTLEKQILLRKIKVSDIYNPQVFSLLNKLERLLQKNKIKIVKK